MRLIPSSLLIVLTILLSACASKGGGSRPETTAPPPAAQPAGETSQPVPVTPAPLSVPLPNPPPRLGEAPPELVDQVVADLAAHLSLPAAQITVVTSETEIWTDGSLGCPKPGQMYTLALTPGYRIVLEAGGQEYTYHTGDDRFVLCEQ